ncbi:MAG: dUTP diphosphatase [Gammaproteobacteria bacterium]|nr:MAG: dUTP diphosphatase [Gammaproteobacteria bacterium]RTZ81716.1 MAG: dUTP diphosphatase [Gammaproteobacteria bacterium]
MKEKLLHMLQLQDRLNRQIDSGWLDAGHEWYRAIWLEAAELMEHYGWKWWKAQQHDIEQIRLELIDIWHFGLSAELARCGGDHQAAADTMLAHMDSGAHAEDDFRANVDNLALHALTDRNLSMPAFLALLDAVGTGFDDLYRIYVGKNVLNRFRQDHGYKEGSYVKNWDGREDNEHLAELAAALEAEGAEFESQLYRELESRYPQSEIASRVSARHRTP